MTPDEVETFARAVRDARRAILTRLAEAWDEGRNAATDRHGDDTDNPYRKALS